VRRLVGRSWVLLASAVPTFGRLLPPPDWTAHAANDYQVFSNLAYSRAGVHELNLDVYKRRDMTGPQPAVMFMHGGFWTAGAKEASLMSLIPWFDMGWNVVNVEYRLARVAPAPAAVEDCVSALRFITEAAKTYDIDTTRIVLTGESAGGHLALMTGMMPESAGRAAAIINWYGITDVCDFMDTPWLGSLSNRKELARHVSPLTYVRPGLPPILTIHGDADTTIPYRHAVRLHQALEQARVPNRLLTIPGGNHGNFTRKQRTHIFTAIREFLIEPRSGGRT
jgi:acetyl esterase/lipase